VKGSESFYALFRRWSSKVSHYTYGGYAIVMLLLGVSMNLFVVAATYAIRGTK
ncbi:unnamed protein product, partial [Symbiodinium necroappetens]